MLGNDTASASASADDENVAKPGHSAARVSQDGFKLDCGDLWRFGELECDAGVVAGVGGWGGAVSGGAERGRAGHC